MHWFQFVYLGGRCGGGGPGRRARGSGDEGGGGGREGVGVGQGGGGEMGESSVVVTRSVLVPLLGSLKTNNWSDLAGDEGGGGGEAWGGGGSGRGRWGQQVKWRGLTGCGGLKTVWSGGPGLERGESGDTRIRVMCGHNGT